MTPGHESRRRNRPRLTAPLWALEGARRRDVSGLSHVQQLIRRLLLDELEQYRREARFPKNPGFAERTPYFIDAAGTRCAMAHLLELGGQSPLVDRIAATRNNAYVRELADEPGLLAWLDAAGLSVEEAAAIQPRYSCATQSECVCGGGVGSPGYPVPAKGVLEVVFPADGATATVERVYGDTLGIKVGDTVPVAIGQKMGQRVLAAIDSAQPGQFGYEGVLLESDGNHLCRSLAVRDAPALTPAQFSQAVTAASCHQALASIDPAWGRACEGSGRWVGGCGSGGEASVALLCALLSAIIYRRVRSLRDHASDE